MTPPFIVIINDNQDILDLYEAILEDTGYAVEVFTATRPALEAMQARVPDLIILDWLFGNEAGGMTVLQEIEMQPALARVPVLVCTAALKAVREIEDTLRSKGIAVVYKPFELDEFVGAVERLLARAPGQELPPEDEQGRGLTPAA